MPRGDSLMLWRIVGIAPWRKKCIAGGDTHNAIACSPGHKMTTDIRNGGPRTLAPVA
jgi:hypothetical protein